MSRTRRYRTPDTMIAPSRLSRTARTFLCTLTLGLVAQPALAQQAVDAPVVYQNAGFIMGDGRVLADGVMVVRAGAIEAIGERATTALPAGAEQVDLQGRTVMPALIDAHAHIGYEAYTGWGAEHYGRENIIENLQRYAWYGFGAVFSAGSDPLELARDIEAARQAGEYHGARLLVASGMAPPGQGPNAAFLAHVLAVEARTGQRILRGAATAQQGREAVREIAASGSGYIKIWVDDRGGAQEKMPAEVYRAIADGRRATHRAGLRRALTGKPLGTLRARPARGHGPPAGGGRGHRAGHRRRCSARSFLRLCGAP